MVYRKAVPYLEAHVSRELLPIFNKGTGGKDQYLNTQAEAGGCYREGFEAGRREVGRFFFSRIGPGALSQGIWASSSRSLLRLGNWVRSTGGLLRVLISCSAPWGRGLLQVLPVW